MEIPTEKSVNIYHVKETALQRAGLIHIARPETLSTFHFHSNKN